MKILKRGFLTSFQDLGRYGFQSIGLNPGGCMDCFSLKLLNTLLGNNQNECAIEMHFPAPIIRFEENCVFAITGADFGASLNNSEVPINKMVFAKEGEVLSFTSKTKGERAYFGIKGGFKLVSWLGSKSTQLQLKHLELVEGMSIIPNSSFEIPFITNFRLSSKALLDINNILRFVPSFEFEKLKPISQMHLIKSDYKITIDSNRMGYKIDGVQLYLEEKVEMISSSASKGCIQLLPNGQLIILMADSQVSGGYPKLGFILENDLSKLSQMGPNSSIRFEKTTMTKALEQLQKTDLLLNKIEKSIKYATKEN